MAQDGTFHAAEVAGRTAGSPSAATDSNIPHPDAINRQRTANSPSIIDELLREPVLAAGENIERFRALVEEVSAAVQPNTLFDRLVVSDLCHALWEEQRFRHQQAALPAATGLKALQCLLASIGFEQNALTIATDYFGEDDEERTKATALVRRLNITDDAITAQASQHNLPILSVLERLMANRQSRRDVILSEYHRRKRKADKLTSRKSVADPLSDRPAIARH
jgi:hypothetical protein